MGGADSDGPGLCKRVCVVCDYMSATEHISQSCERNNGEMRKSLCTFAASRK